jgi:glucose/mannose transport system substrate-binding protein
VHTLEVVLAGTCRANKYRGPWDGSVAWIDECVAAALDTFRRMLGEANADHPALDWAAAAQQLVDGKAAMFIMGDWTDCYFTSKGFTVDGCPPR